MGLDEKKKARDWELLNAGRFGAMMTDNIFLMSVMGAVVDVFNDDQPWEQKKELFAEALSPKRIEALISIKGEEEPDECDRHLLGVLEDLVHDYIVDVDYLYEIMKKAEEAIYFVNYQEYETAEDTGEEFGIYREDLTRFPGYFTEFKEAVSAELLNETENNIHKRVIEKLYKVPISNYNEKGIWAEVNKEGELIRAGSICYEVDGVDLGTTEECLFKCADVVKRCSGALNK